MPAVRRKASERATRQTERVLDSDVQICGETVVIKGRKLRTTAIFDTFWKFTAERQAIYERRRSGQPPP